MGIVASNFGTLLDPHSGDDEIDPIYNPLWIFKLENSPLLSDVNHKDNVTSRTSKFRRGVYRGYFTDLIPEIYQEIVGDREGNLSLLVDYISSDDLLIRKLERELAEHSNNFKIKF